MVRHADTNLCFFQLPEESKIPNVGELARLLKEKHGLLIGSGYGDGTKCRFAVHKDLSQGDVEKAAKAFEDVLI